MAKTNELVDPKAFQQEESNSDQILKGLEPRLNQSIIALDVLVLSCCNHQVCSVDSIITFCYSEYAVCPNRNGRKFVWHNIRIADDITHSYTRSRLLFAPNGVPHFGGHTAATR